MTKGIIPSCLACTFWLHCTSTRVRWAISYKHLPLPAAPTHKFGTEREEKRGTREKRGEWIVYLTDPGSLWTQSLPLEIRMEQAAQERETESSQRSCLNLFLLCCNTHWHTHTLAHTYSEAIVIGIYCWACVQNCFPGQTPLEQFPVLFSLS